MLARTSLPVANLSEKVPVSTWECHRMERCSWFRMKEICVTPWCRIVSLLIASLMVTGCRGVQALPPIEPTYVPPQAQATIFVVDGVGGYQSCARVLNLVVAQDRLPLSVQGVFWNHGLGKPIADLTDQSNRVQEGQRLAQTIQIHRQTYPGQPIHLISHSAGGGVLLTAVESLPPNSVERIILLSPAVSQKADIRPALRCARLGVDVYTSDRDWFYLGLGVRLFGTADGQRGSGAAGRYGFNNSAYNPEDAILYARFRQHPWDPALAWTGNEGQHTGTFQAAFLRAYIVPLLVNR